MNPKKLLWTERYRPSSIDELIVPQRIYDKLNKGLYQNFLFQVESNSFKYLVKAIY